MPARTAPTGKPPFCLTIAGLDPTGGAGATADLRVFRHLDCVGLCALTALTPQNTRGVKGIHPVSREALRQELSAVMEDGVPAAAKTGQIPNKELAEEIIRVLRRYPLPLVVDPVMVPTRGRWLVEKEAVATLRRRLLPLAAITTPNCEEAAWLADMPSVRTPAEMEAAARRLVPGLCPAVVITGGDGPDGGAWDLFFDGKTLRWFKAARRPVGDIHGSGCHYSAAVAGYLARGETLVEAVAKAKRLISGFIDRRLLDPTGQMKILFS